VQKVHRIPANGGHRHKDGSDLIANSTHIRRRTTGTDWRNPGSGGIPGIDGNVAGRAAGKVWLRPEGIRNPALPLMTEAARACSGRLFLRLAGKFRAFRAR